MSNSNRFADPGATGDPRSIELIKKRIKEGLSAAVIAQRIGCSTRYVYSIKKKMKEEEGI